MFVKLYIINIAPRKKTRNQLKFYALTTQSVVVLSDHVFVNLYTWMAQSIGRAYFSDGIMGIATGILSVL